MLKDVLKGAYWGVLNRLPDNLAVRVLYLRTFKRLPSLTRPTTFNEKITWRKLYQRDPRFKVYADKIAVKQEIARLVGENCVIKTLWTGDFPEAIPFSQLKPPYVIKTNHGSNSIIFIRSEAEIDKTWIATTLRKRLSRSHAHMWREWGYIGIVPKIVVEEMVFGADGNVPEDYKFFVYDGQVHYIQVDYNRFKDHKRNLYSRDWQLAPVKFTYPNRGSASPPPVCLDELLRVAETIGSQFDFARVDLYATTAGVKFGEVTFYPGAGLELYEPAEWDEKLGAPWKLCRNHVDKRIAGPEAHGISERWPSSSGADRSAMASRDGAGEDGLGQRSAVKPNRKTPSHWA